MSTRRSMPSTIVVFGRGSVRTGEAYQLTAASRHRVEAAVAFVEANHSAYATAPPTILFTGGWGGAATGIAAPRLEDREAILMRNYALSIATHQFISEVEPESSSTLQDVLLTRRRVIDSDQHFDRNHPLGVVAQRGHLRRITFLAQRTLVRRRAIMKIAAPGPDQRSAGLPEWLLTLAYRVLCIGDPTEDGLLAREAYLVRVLDNARRRRTT